VINLLLVANIFIVTTNYDPSRGNSLTRDASLFSKNKHLSRSLVVSEPRRIVV